jgi:hypothetical protein
MFRLRSRAWCIPLLAVACGATSCNSSFKDYCEKALDCRNHNDADVEACEISNGAEEDVADLKGCTEQYEAAFACRDAKGRCQEVMPGVIVYVSSDVCQGENDRLTQCID